MADLYISEGASSDLVEPLQNATNVSLKPTPIAQITPDRGKFLRLEAESIGERFGLPVYMDLNAADGSDLPVNTKVVIELQMANGDDFHTVSVPLKNISFYNSNTVNEQRDSDRQHNALIPLVWPEASDATGTRDHIDVRDVDTATVSIVSDKQVDWSVSQFFIDNDAVREIERE